jgi:hypothetical protein
MRTLQIFVASSSEGLEAARAIQLQLRDIGTVRLWNEGVFGLGRTTIESLEAAVRGSDIAVLVLRADDLLVSRGSRVPVGRDNILFELGLFIGYLGRDRTFVAYDKSKPAKVLSDLAGVALAEFDGSDPRELVTAVGPACTLIRQAIERATLPNEVWHSSWQLGCKTYRERLELRIDARGSIVGRRLYDEVGGPLHRIYRVQGFRGKGFDWIEYHEENGAGGGALLLRHLGSGKLRGLITAGHCDTGVLRCYLNQWVLADSEDAYNPEWLLKVGEVT